MIVHYCDITYKVNTKNLALAIGNFDGLHKGHFSILNEAIKFAKQKKLKTINENHF